MKRLGLLWRVFYNTLTISAFTFGGGYVMVPIMARRFSGKLKWLPEDEMLELAALAQACPGAMAVNAAALVGWRMAGFFGALAAVFGAVLPPLVILSLVSWFYTLFSGNEYVSAALRGMQAGIAAVIADVVCTMARPYFKRDELFSLGLMLCAFAVACFTSVNVVFIILAAVIIGVLRTFFDRRRGAAGK